MIFLKNSYLEEVSEKDYRQKFMKLSQKLFKATFWLAIRVINRTHPIIKSKLKA